MDQTDDLLGNCAVCGKIARLRCSGCKQEFYCDKDHQREGWPNHKLICRAWLIEETEELGRFLVANRDLTAGDLIILEAPLIWGPAPHTDRRVCVGCGADMATARCTICTWPACKPDCEGLFDERRHGMECAFLSKAKILPRCNILLVLRALILRRKHSKRWSVLSKLQSHEESRGPKTDAHNEMRSIERHLETLFHHDPKLRELLPKICGIIDVNALETNPPEGSAGIYEVTSLLEHRCISNTRHTFLIDDKGRPKISVSAVTSIKKGEHLTTTYTHVLWSTRVRREHLMATKYFACSCERCSDPTELGTNLGSLKCPCCPGYITPNNPLEADSEWSCKSCPGVLSAKEAADITDRLGEEVENAMSMANRQVLSDFLPRLMVMFHPNHQHCIAVGHSLVQLLDREDTRKEEICRRILDVTRVLDPFGARLGLYTAVALRELATCPGSDRRSLLAMASMLLKPEPLNSPGEKLLRIVDSELQSLL